MSGFNMPPGVNPSDIPGNRPEDVRPSLQDEHHEMIASLARLCPPREPASWEGRGLWLMALIKYQNDVMRAIEPVLELAASQAADNAGAKDEDISIIRGAFADWTAPMQAAAEELEER